MSVRYSVESQSWCQLDQMIFAQHRPTLQCPILTLSQHESIYESWQAKPASVRGGQRGGGQSGMPPRNGDMTDMRCLWVCNSIKPKKSWGGLAMTTGPFVGCIHAVCKKCLRHTEWAPRPLAHGCGELESSVDAHQDVGIWKIRPTEIRNHPGNR